MKTHKFQIFMVTDGDGKLCVSNNGSLAFMLSEHAKEVLIDHARTGAKDLRIISGEINYSA